MAGPNHAKGQRQAQLYLDEFYNSLFKFRDPHPFQTYFGVDKEVAEAIWKRKIAGPPKGSTFRDAINIGGRGSAKTYISLYTALSLSTDYEDNLGIIVRRHWNELKNSIILDFRKVLEQVTDGHPEYLVEGPNRKEGYYEYVVFTRGKPSYILVKPEPEKASDREIEDAFKGPEYGWFLCDELTQLKRITWSTLQDNLRRPHIHNRRGLGMTNPPTKGHWLYELAREQEAATARGERAQVLIIRSRMEDNPYLPSDYIENMKRKYKNDPVRYAMYVEGRDGIELEGTPVFKGAYKIGVNDGDLKYDPFRPLVVGMDFGWNRAAAIFLQVTQLGYLNILGEMRAEHMTVERFGNAVRDYIKQNYPKIPLSMVEYFGDPAGRQTDQTSGQTAIAILRDKCGMHVRWSKVRREVGLDMMREALTDYGINAARPRLVLDKSRCHDLITGFIGGYRWRQSGGVTKPEPHKDGYFDHYMDALRYALQNVMGVRQKQKQFTEPIFADGMKPRNKIYQG